MAQAAAALKSRLAISPLNLLLSTTDIKGTRFSSNKSIISKVAIDKEHEDIISYTFSNRSYAASGKTIVFAYYYYVHQK